MAVANTLLDFASGEGMPLTPMALQKHTYFSHGWYAGNTAQPLFGDTIQAWKWGPVIPSLYHAFKWAKNERITKYGLALNPANGQTEIPKVTDASLSDFIKRVWNAYKSYSPMALSAISHEQGSPWYRAYQDDAGGPVRNVEIPLDWIAKFYAAKVAALRQHASAT